MNDVDSNKQTYREGKIRCFEQKLEVEMLKYTNLLKTYNRLDKVLSVALGICSVLNVICTTSALSTAATGIGAIACIPLSSLAVVNWLGMMGLTVLSKRIHNKRKKHKDTVQLIRTSKSKIEDTVSKALDDDDISDLKFTGIVTCLDSYYDEIQALRKPSHTVKKVCQYQTNFPLK